MPNWCLNTIRVVGDNDSVNKIPSFFVKKDSSEYLDFTQLIPLEKKEDITLDLNQRSEFWGIKSSGMEINGYNIKSLDKNNSMLEFESDTPWNPPLSFFYWISNMYPTLLFQVVYDEPGMSFSGNFIVQNGEILESDEYEESTMTWALEEELENEKDPKRKKELQKMINYKVNLGKKWMKSPNKLLKIRNDKIKKDFIKCC